MSAWDFSKFGGPHSPARLMASPADMRWINDKGEPAGGYGLGDDAMAMRALAVRDPLYLADKVLGLHLLGNPAPEHRRVADLICQQKNYLLLHHRGSFKTTLSDEVGTIFQWLRFPNDRILFLQATLENGKALSQQVRVHFKKTKALRALFPEYAINTASDAGAILAWSIPCRTVNKREHSLEIGTPETSLSGRHYEVLAGSDISNEQTSPPPCGRGTIEEAIKLRNWIATTDGLLESKVVCPRAHKRWDGTRWSDMDIYAYLIENDTKDAIEKVIGGVTVDDEGRFCSSVPGFTHELLQEIRERPTMSAALWAANYKNTPIIGEGAMQFRPEWFKPYLLDDDFREIMLPTLDVAITVDPAWSKQEKNPGADRSACVAAGTCPNGNFYVLEARAGRWGPSELLDVLYAMITTWSDRLTWVGIESGTQSTSLIETFTNELYRDFPYVPFRKLPPKGHNKLVRAVPLHTHAQRHGIYVRPAEHSELVQECLSFPGGKHDDYVDALAYRAQDLRVPFGRKQDEETAALDNPRGLMTGQDVFDIIAARNSDRTLMPWETLRN